MVATQIACFACLVMLIQSKCVTCSNSFKKNLFWAMICILCAYDSYPYHPYLEDYEIFVCLKTNW